MSSTEVEATETYFWMDSNGYIDIEIPGSAILDICKSGSADAAVEDWQGKIKRPESATPERVYAIARNMGYSVADSFSIDDDKDNWERIIHAAAWDICDDPKGRIA